MTDARVAAALADVLGIETEARAAWSSTEDLPEKDAALVVMRQATALRKSLESWIGRRAARAQLAHR